MIADVHLHYLLFFSEKNAALHLFITIRFVQHGAAILATAELLLSFSVPG